MRQSLAISLFSLLAGANVAFAACETHSFTTCDDGIVHWFDPNNGQVCDPLDCGGGRAPPRTDVPGCPLYTGTLSVAGISILSCWKPSSAIQSATSTAVSETEPTSEAVTTSAASTSDAQRTTEQPASETSTGEPTTASAPSSSSVTSHPVTTSASTSIKVPITSPATLSTKSQYTHAASNGTSISAPAATSSVPNAGNIMGDSLMAVVGAAIGVIAML
ncbi:hypothetical protein V8C42DRAFT_315401 [Trichoderma barbatum]